MSTLEGMKRIEDFNWNSDNARLNFITMFGSFMACPEPINDGVVAVFFGMVHKVAMIFDERGIGSNRAYEWAARTTQNKHLSSYDTLCIYKSIR